MLLNELTRVALKYVQIGILYCSFILLRMFSYEKLVLLSLNNGSVLVYVRGFSYLLCYPGLLPNHK